MSKHVNQYRTDAARWQAVVNRDRHADGLFYYSVRTTGVYCQPSCGSRQARRENVRFHATRDDARRAGFRACKRCRPDGIAATEEQAKIVADACRRIERATEAPSLEELAIAVGLSRFHFQRMFKRLTGLTPKAYANAVRGQRVRGNLAGNYAVTASIHAAGFPSSGRFYAQARTMLGMSPRKFRSGGEGTTIHFALGTCSLGNLLVAATEQGICSILLGDDPQQLVRDLEVRFASATLVSGDRRFDRWIARVVGFVDDPRLGLGLPLDIRGTAFQTRVWLALEAIGPGETITYTKLAKKIGAPKSVRAVAAACAANPLAVAIPCHRVVRTDGGLAGYRWGIERKQALLACEAGK